MFVGHYAVALAAKRAAPKATSHSLLGLIGWGLAFGLVYRMTTGYGRGALVVAGLVASHWVLDLVVHIPDLPLIPGGGPLLGFGLWNSVIGTVVVESFLLAAGLWIYLRTSPPHTVARTVAFWVLIAFIVVVGNMHGTPPDPKTIAWGALIGWLLPLWAWWADSGKHVADPA
jgi:hypothetical protein